MILKKQVVGILLALAMPVCALAQNVTVKGQVKDGAGEPLMAAAVAEVGTSNGVATDLNGNYTITVASDATLQFSFMGYNTVTEPVRGRTTINVTLSEDVELLDEAKKAMPDNASLYYVEGNIYTGIKDYDKADAAYNKALEIQPGYDMAYYGLATTLLKRGEDLVDAMNALDVREWKKYDEMKVQLDNIYKSAIDPFEKCYNSSSVPEVKAAAADFLKRLNFQLRGEGAEYQAAYEKWSAVVAE